VPGFLMAWLESDFSLKLLMEPLLPWACFLLRSIPVDTPAPAFEWYALATEFSTWTTWLKSGVILGKSCCFSSLTKECGGVNCVKVDTWTNFGSTMLILQLSVLHMFGKQSLNEGDEKRRLSRGGAKVNPRYFGT
jgi:hypothetical protein